MQRLDIAFSILAALTCLFDLRLVIGSTNVLYSMGIWIVIRFDWNLRFAGTPGGSERRLCSRGRCAFYTIRDLRSFRERVLDDRLIGSRYSDLFSNVYSDDSIHPIYPITVGSPYYSESYAARDESEHFHSQFEANGPQCPVARIKQPVEWETEQGGLISDSFFI